MSFTYCCSKGHVVYNNTDFCRYAKKEYYDCMKTMICLAETEHIQIPEETICEVLTSIDGYYFLCHKISLDDPIWNRWFFISINKYLYQYINLKQFVFKWKQKNKL